MTTILDRITSMSDADLARLHENAQRLKGANTAREQAQAAEILPLVLAEQAQRRAALPPKAPSSKGGRSKPADPAALPPVAA